MPRVLVTGSTDGIGLATAVSLQEAGSDVVVHARNQRRLSAVDDMISNRTRTIIGDLADPNQVENLALQANKLGSFDAVIHNAGAFDHPDMLQVNLLAPYVLTALVAAPRLIYLSSNMHRDGRADVALVNETGKSATYADTKLLLTVFMAAIGRHWPHVVTHAVDPGWVATKMGGPTAPDELDQAHLTQVWLATSNDSLVAKSGSYWRHGKINQPHPAVHNEIFQDDLLTVLAKRTGVDVPET